MRRRLRSLDGRLRTTRTDTAAFEAPDETTTRGCEFCDGADPAAHTPMQELIGTGRPRVVVESSRFYVTPTLGCFVPGYVLVVPRAHVHSFGQLEAAPLAEAEGVIDVMAAWLAATYRMPVLAFEYGLADGNRRIQHAHWHLLPTEADLHGWLGDRLDGQAIGSLADLSGGPCSYIAVRDQDGRMATYPCEDTDPAARIRLRRVVAELDPRVPVERWDWAAHPCPGLIRATVDDLTMPRRRTPTGTRVPPAPRRADW